MKEIIAAEAAPRALGPYSQGVKAGDCLYVAGQLGLDPATGKLVDGGAAAEAEQAFKNAEAVCAAAGTALAHAVRVVVYLADLADFDAVNKVMAGIFHHDPPARTTIQAARLPRDARVEIEITAWIGR